jgi:hypothetical protein
MPSIANNSPAGAPSKDGCGPDDAALRSIERVAQDLGAALSREAIEYAWDRDWVNAWQYWFLSDTAEAERLSPRQWATRYELNETVVLRRRIEAGRIEAERRGVYRAH